MNWILSAILSATGGSLDAMFDVIIKLLEGWDDNDSGVDDAIANILKELQDVFGAIKTSDYKEILTSTLKIAEIIIHEADNDGKGLDHEAVEKLKDIIKSIEK